MTARPRPRSIHRAVGRGLALALVASALVVVAPVVEIPRAFAPLRVERESVGLARAGAEEPGRARTGLVATRAFATIGVELDRPTGQQVRVRWRSDGTWSAWQELDVSADEGPDPGSAEDHGATTSAPLWVGHADAYQLDVPEAAVDRDVTAVLVRAEQHPRAIAGDVAVAGASLNAPSIRSRSSWGARQPSAAPTYDDELKLVVVHHSATANGYGADEVPAILRSIQAFHIDGRGWNDIAYNFVVDRFGRIWEGRGESDRLARGAHAQGFNTDTVGVMVLGEYGSVRPTDAQLDAVADIIAWKFANERVDPASTVAYTSAGSPTIPDGQVVTLPRVIGHRDVGSTSCPGQFLAEVLWAIRARVLDRAVVARSPAGAIDPVAFAPGQLRFSGWAADPDTSGPIDVHLYVDGQGYNLGAASLDRPDVAAAHRRLGPAHGYARTLSGLAPGPHDACAYAINTSIGANVLIGCVRAVIPSGDPIGQVSVAAGLPDGRVRVAGYTVDPDATDLVAVHVYVDGRGTNLGPTSVDSAEGRAALPLFAGTRGFDVTLSGFAPGPHDVCTFAINVGSGANRALACSRVVVPSGPPIGTLDAAVGLPDGRVAVGGWSLDPDTAASIPVHVYVGSRGYNLDAAVAPRADVAAAYPGYGPLHGYGATVAGIPPGTTTACAYGINVGVGQNRQLACRRVTVPGGPPVGSFDAAVVVGSGSLYVAGWVVDPDTVAPASVHVYVGAIGRNLEAATAPRADVAAALGAYGANHGFTARLDGLPSGSQRVCAYGIDVAGADGNVLLGCKDVVL